MNIIRILGRDKWAIKFDKRGNAARKSRLVYARFQQ